MNEWRGTIPGPTPHARAVVIAGFLAERGVHQLTLTCAGLRLTMAARGTDLPGELCSRASWILETRGVRFEDDAAGVLWTCSDEATAAELRTLGSSA